MKLALTFLMLCLTQLALAKSLSERRLKEEMLARVETLIEKSKEGRELLKKKDAPGACRVIGEIFRLLPEHLVAVGSRMDLLDAKVIRMEQETKMMLIYVHQRVNICAQDNGDHLDLEETAGKLRSMRRAFQKQKRRINRADLGFQNDYKYYYEF